VADGGNISLGGDGIVTATPEAIDVAAGLLRDGELVAFPTETVYGLGADATRDDAANAVYAVKGRPRSNPLIIHIPDVDSASEIACFDERADILAEAFWPGPLTLILPRRPKCAVSSHACAGLDTVALRIPANDIALDLLRKTRRPIAGPSANASGRTSPTTARHVAQSLGNAISLILDGGPCQVGIESTIITLAHKRPLLLRPGGIPVEEIERLIGPISEPANNTDMAPSSPGRAMSHYAPNLLVRLNAASVDAKEALLAFGPDAPEGAAITLNLSAEGDIDEAAANLYRMLLELDDPAFTRIAVMALPDIGVGRAINDRLRRAAAPRSQE
jgi:L-threonylcarbamoyladenylate synthase